MSLIFQATYYERFGQGHTDDSDLRATIDATFLAPQGREVETTRAFGVNAQICRLLL